MISGPKGSPDPHAGQLSLAFDHVPRALKRHGLRDAHPRPLVGRRPNEGGFHSQRILASPRVWTWPHVEMRTGSTYTLVCADLDRPGAEADLVAAIDELAVPPPRTGTRAVARTGTCWPRGRSRSPCTATRPRARRRSGS